MAYQTGTSTGPADLLDKLRAFLLANGWTIEAWRYTVAQPTYRWLVVSKSGFFFHFFEWLQAQSPPHTVAAHIYVMYSTSYNSAGDYNAQPPWYEPAQANEIIGPYSSYHFFEGVGRSGPYVYCAVELGVGEFRHFGAGVLEKVGTYTGGEFVFGTRHDTRAAYTAQTVAGSQGFVHSWPFDDSLWLAGGAAIAAAATNVRCVESFGGTFCTARRDAPSGRQLRCGALRGEQGVTGGTNGSANAAFWAAGPLTSIAVSPMIRVPCFVERGIDDSFALIGEPPNFRHFDIRYANPGDEITLGTEVWKVFPVIRKGTGGAVAISGNYGIAYRKS